MSGPPPVPTLGLGTTTTTTTGHNYHTRPRRSITSYTQGQYSTTTTMPASATSSQHTTKSATGSRTASQGQSQSQGGRRVKAELNIYDVSDEVENEVDKDDDDAEIDEVAESKLEMRRERNRIKQRNLRKRRVDYTQGLEDSIKALRSEVTHSRQSITTLSGNDSNYKQWIQDLEMALFRQGQASEVEGLRRVWGRTIHTLPVKPKKEGPGGGVGNKKGKGRLPATASGSGTGSMDRVQPSLHSARYGTGGATHSRSLDPLDPLSTLVQAAMVSDQSLVQPGSYSAHVPLPQPQPPAHGQSHHLAMAESSSTTFHPHLPTMSPSYAFPPTHPTDHPPPPQLPSRVPMPMATPTSRPHWGSVSHNPSRRPSTSYNPSSSWDFQIQTQNHPHSQGQGQGPGSIDPQPQPQLKRKRSVSGPTGNYSESLRGPFHSLKSLSEPATARRSFQFHPHPQLESSSAITLPPILSLNTTPLEHRQLRQDRHFLSTEARAQHSSTKTQTPHLFSDEPSPEASAATPHIHPQDHHQSQQTQSQRQQQQQQQQTSGSMPIGVGSRPSGLGLGITLPPLRVPTSAPTTPPTTTNIPLMDSQSMESRETSPSGASLAKSMSIDHLLTPKASRSDELRE